VEKGRVAARQQVWRNLYNALILCVFQNPGVARVQAALNCATGWDFGVDELVTTGKRILTLKRLFNLRRGLSGADDCLPRLLRAPLAEGGTEGHVPDVSVLLAGAYDELDWNPASGVPGADLLRQLRID
jgi:aldehyde:ferredoxin oxidoreductase